MKKTMFKKSISLMLTVLMIMSCWVFFPGMIPEASAAATVSYSVTLNFNLNNCASGGHILIYYYPVNSDGTLDKSNSNLTYTFMNSLTQYSSGNNQTYTAGVSGDNRPSGDSSKSTGDIPGWPYKIYIQTNRKNSKSADIQIKSIKIGTKTVLSTDTQWSCSNTNRTFETGGTYDNIATTWPEPSWSSSSTISGTTINVPTSGSNTVSLSQKATWVDQYGVTWPQAINYSVSGSGVSLSQSNNTLTGVTVNSSVLKQFGASKTKNITLTATASGLNKTQTANITLQAPVELTYENLFNFCDFIYSDSIAAGGGGATASGSSITYDINAGTITATTGGGEVFTSSNSSAEMYSIPVTAGEEYKFDFDVEYKGSIQTFVFFYNNAGQQVTVPGSSNYFYNAYSPDTITFTVPDGATRVGFRFGTYGDAGNYAKYSNIRFYETSRQDIVDCAKEQGVSRVVYNYNDPIASSTVPTITRPGYTFGGWFVKDVDNTGDGEWDPITMYTDGAYSMQATFVIYSNWTENSYNIAFNANGGSGSMSAINSVKYSESKNLSANAFSRTGYTFAGWNTKADGTGAAYADKATVSKLSEANGATVTLYAQWTINKYTVKFVNAAGTTVSETKYDYGTSASAIAKPANTASGYDTTQHYKYSWPTINDLGAADVEYKEIKTGTNHSFGESITKNATCTTPGEKKYTCDCGYSYTETIEATGHSYESVVTPPSCTEQGYTTHTCSKCGDSYKDTYTGPDNHRYTVKVETKAPTCTDQGYTVYKCENCSATENRDFTDAQHTLTQVDKQDATCTAPGWEAYEYCSKCDYTTKIDIPALGHTEATREENRNEATCGAAGSYDLVTYCSVCKEVLGTEEKTIPATGNHSWGDGEVTTQPTCITPGVRTYTCSVCNDTKTETISATGKHKYGDWAQYNDGTTHRRVCTADENCTAYEEGGHNFSGAVRKDENSNYHDYKCEKCDAYGVGATLNVKEECFGEGTSFTQIDSDGARHNEKCKCGREKTDAHTYGTWVADPENKADDKGTMSRVCSECQYKQTSSCNYEKTTNYKAPTCTENGYQGWKCKDADCENGYTEILTAKGHAFGETVTVNSATCTVDGNKAYKQCTVCNLYFAADAENTATDGKADNKDFIIDALGHAYADTFTVDKKATCEEDGSKSKHCSRCDAKSEVTVIAKRGHTLVDDKVEKEATCLNNGVMKQKCSNTATGEYEDCVYTTTRVIPAKGHAFGETVTANGATCTVDGNKAYKQCTVCNLYFAADAENTATDGKADNKDFIIDALGHAYADTFTVDKKATCEEDGSKSKHCSRCDAKSEVTVIAKRGHTLVDDKVEKEATCLNNGVMKQKCSNTATGEYEDCVYTTTRVIPAKGHAFGETVTANGATCTVDGNKAYKQCTVCNLYFAADAENTATDGKADNKEFIIEAKGHDYKAVVTDPTCEDDGYTTHICSRCNDSYVDNYVNALGHDYASEVTTPATCLTDGLRTYTCKNDSTHTYTEVIQALGHIDENNNGYCDRCSVLICDHKDQVLVTKNDKEATCLEDGYTGDKHCAKCDEVVEKGTVIDKLGHKDENKDHKCDNKNCDVIQGKHEDADKNHVCDYGCSESIGTCEDENKDHKCDYGCTKTYGEHKDANKDHTCDYGCSVAIGDCKDEDKDHKCDYGCSVAIGEHADSAEDKDHICDYCESDEVLENCTESDWITDVAATCEGKGSQYKKCTVCDKELKREDLNPINHNYDTTKTEENLTRPTKNADGTWAQGYYTYTCKNNSEHKDKEYVDRASYTAYEAALVNLNELLKTDITDEARGTIEKAIADNEVADNLIATEQPLINAATAKLVEAFNNNNNSGSLKTYTVTFVIDGKETKVTVISGQAATTPTEVKKAYDETYHYAFNGWDNEEVTNVTSDLIVTAQFKAIEHTYTHTDKDDTYHTDECACGYNKDVKHTETSVVTTKATCEADGLRTYTCSVCSGTRTEEIAKREHVYKDNGVDTNATCTTAGVMKTICTNTETETHKACTHESTRVIDIDPTAHKYAEATYVWEKTSDGWNCTATRVCANNSDHTETATAKITSAVKTSATCTVDGWTTYTATFEETWAKTQTKELQDIPAIDHDMQKTADEIAPTCEKTGKKAVFTCSYGCGHVTGGEEIKTLEHSYTGEYKWNDTTVPMSHSRKCVNGCGGYGEAENCTFNTITVEPTCMSEGYVLHTCTVCSGSYKTDVTTASGHDWSDWQHVEGTKKHTRTCKNNTEHTETVDCVMTNRYIAPTCTKEGISEDTCTECNYKYESKKISAHGHRYVDEEGKENAVIIEPGCTTAGSKYLVCLLCGAKTEPDEFGQATGHYLFVQEGYAATCTEDGRTVYKHCIKENCDYVEHAQIIKATGHQDDGHGNCQNCGGPLYDNGSKACSCLCHSDSGLMKFLYKIVLFFWKLFRIKGDCPCGAVHY